MKAICTLILLFFSTHFFSQFIDSTVIDNNNVYFKEYYNKKKTKISKEYILKKYKKKGVVINIYTIDNETTKPNINQYDRLYDGKYFEYHKNGNIKVEFEYSTGWLFKILQTKDRSGKDLPNNIFKNGNGVAYIYKNKNIIEKEVDYNLDSGEVNIKYYSKNTSIEYHYTYGECNFIKKYKKLTLIEETIYENDKILELHKFKKGQLDHTFFYQDNQLTKDITYLKNSNDKVTTCWKDGIPIKTEWFLNGETTIE